MTRKFYTDLERVKKNINLISEDIKMNFVSYSGFHAEIKILDFVNHYGLNKDKIIIGISKLSCVSCYIVIDYFNKKNDGHISIRGCHGKVYRNWHYDPFWDNKCGKYLIEQLAEMFCSGQLTQQKMEPDSSESNTLGLTPSTSLESMAPIEGTPNIDIDVNSLIKGNANSTTGKTYIYNTLSKLLNLQENFPQFRILNNNGTIIVNNRHIKVSDFLEKKPSIMKWLDDWQE